MSLNNSHNNQNNNTTNEIDNDDNVDVVDNVGVGVGVDVDDVDVDVDDDDDDDVDEYISLDGNNDNENNNNHDGNEEDSVMFIDASQDLVEEIAIDDNTHDADEDESSNDDDDDDSSDDGDDNDVDSSDEDGSDYDDEDNTDIVARSTPAQDQRQIQIPSLTNVIGTLIGTAVMSGVNGLLQRSTSGSNAPNSVMNDRDRRRSIQQIMTNTTLTEQEKRIQIQQLMMNNNNNNNSNTNANSSRGTDDNDVTTTEDNNTSLDSNELGDNNVIDIRTQEEMQLQKLVTNATKACTHYERNCVIISPCCQQIFGCRICHDEKFENDTINTIKNPKNTFNNSDVQGDQQNQQQQQQQELSKLDHVPMNRYLINEIICTKCYTRQSCTTPNNTNKCNNCKIQLGQYYCSICNLWMSSSKQPFHCNLCGFCRVGNRSNFIHCNQCNMCIAASTYTTHICSIDKYNNNCPICHDNMFTSRIAPQELICGHTIHTKCYNELIKYDYRCPICKKSFITRSAMIPFWTQRAIEIQNTPIPLSIQRTVTILCIDCDTKSTNCSWHVLGIQCPSCSSFNTVVDEVTTDNNNTSPAT